MTNPNLSAMSNAVRGTFDRRLVGGMIIGAAIMISAMAAAAPDSTGSWFSGMFNTGSSSAASTTQDLLTQQESAIAAAMRDEPCDMVDAIDRANKIHLELAKATPDVESLFDVNGDCFSSISQIFDLSFAIPSLASILAAAQDAVLKYAQKKVCTAVNKVSGMVTSPINKAIGTINTMPGFGDINGMVNSQVGGALGAIDADLGSEYHVPATPGSYTVNTNPFNTSQTTFSNASGSGSGNGQINTDITAINNLTNQIAAQQVQYNESVMNLDTAQNNYNSCNGSSHNCSASASALASAQQRLTQDQAQLAALNQRLSQVVNQQGASTQRPAAVPAQPQAAAQAQAPGSFWSSVSSLFN